MKILVVCQYYYPEPFRIHEVCEALVSIGHEVTVLTGLPNYPMGVIPEDYQNGKRRDEVINGVHIIRVNEIPRKDGKISLAKNYVSYVWNASCKVPKMDKYDVTFVYQLSPVLMAIPAFVARWFNRSKKIALYCLDLWPESLASFGISHDSVFFKFIKFVSKRIYNGVDVLGYTSRMFLDYFKDELKLKQKSYMYIPQFADSLFDDIESKEHRGINFVFAGNIGKMQSVETIIKAAAAIDNSEIKWHIVGDGFAYNDCVKLAEKLNVLDRVTFYGRLPVEEMPRFYALADAMLVTLSDNKTISYTLPGKVQSYMAAGKPILAAANGEIKTVIKEADCGLCASAEDYKELAKYAVNMAGEDLSAYGVNARKYYDEHFGKAFHIENIERMLTKLKGEMI